MKHNFRSLLSLAMALVLVFALSASSLAYGTPDLDSAIVTDNDSMRQVVVDGVTATFDKIARRLTITYADGTSNTVSVDHPESSGMYAALTTDVGVTIIEQEYVYFHAYSYKKTDNRNYFWAINIPASSGGELLVWDNGTTEAGYCKDFKTSLKAAQQANNTMLTSGIVGIAAVALAVLSGPGAAVTSSAARTALIAGLKALGVAADVGVIAAGVMCWTELSNVRDDYNAVARIMA